MQVYRWILNIFFLFQINHSDQWSIQNHSKMTSLSQSFSNFKDYLPFSSTDSKNYRSNKSKRAYNSLDPEVGFRLKLTPGDQDKASTSHQEYSGPELIVHIIGARHLPSIFGLKRVEGYAMKVTMTLLLHFKNLTVCWLAYRWNYSQELYDLTPQFKRPHGRHSMKVLSSLWNQPPSNGIVFVRCKMKLFLNIFDSDRRLEIEQKPLSLTINRFRNDYLKVISLW